MSVNDHPQTAQERADLLDRLDRIQEDFATLRREFEDLNSARASAATDLQICRDERDRFRRIMNGYVDFSEGPIRSNVSNWKTLQDDSYFEKHPCYQGLTDPGDGDEAVRAIAHFVELNPDMNVVVIGCGYGRDSIQIAPRVRRVFGIDVNQTILDKAMGFTASHGVENFTPILADTYATDIPATIDLVFSIVVMQHLTRDLVKDYITNLSRRLRPSGSMIIQFVEEIVDDVGLADADLRPYEPSVSWTVTQIVRLARLCGMTMKEVRTIAAGPAAMWHWAHLVPAASV